MNKIKNILLLILTVTLVGTINMAHVKAATGTIKAKASSSSVILGNSVTVTVTVSSSSALGTWQYVLNYDTAKLKLTSTDNATYIVDYGNGSKTSASYTYTFKTIATGNATVSVKNASIIDYASENELTTTASGCTISINKEVIVTKSSNANLSALTVSDGTLTPTFSTNTTDYQVNVNSLIDKIKITATKADSNATVSGDGDLNVSEGVNSFKIVVTAENGTSKTYNLTVNIIDANPIKVKIDNIDYTVIKKAGTITVPNNYKQTSTPISGIDIVTYENDINKLTLVGLKDKDGHSSLFVYDANKGTYTPYSEFHGAATTLYLFKPESKLKIPSGYKKADIKINDKQVSGWRNANNIDFSLVYGMNIETGKTNFYLYDKIENTFQRYDNSVLVSLQKALDIDLIIIITVSSLFLITIVLFIIKLVNKNKKLKRI